MFEILSLKNGIDMVLQKKSKLHSTLRTMRKKAAQA